MPGKKLQYSVPLPLPALQQQQQQQQQQQKQQQKHAQPQTPSTATEDLSLQQQSVSSNAACPPSWLLLPLRTILSSALKYLHLNTIISPTTQDLIHGDFHFCGASVWIRGSKDMETLFRQGFFGKGTLSRSEATWKERTAGSSQGVSLEDITRQRRVERAQLKMEKLVQAAQGNASALAASTTPVISSNTSSTNASVSTTPTSTVSSATQSQHPQSNKTVQQSIMLLTSPVGDEPEGVNQETVGSSSSGGSGENEEHLQLSLEEAFFLVFAVECIAVSEKKTSSTCDQLLLGGGSDGFTPFSIQECWLRFAQASVFAGRSSMALPMPMPEISPDNPFIVRYAAYHHYRSLGWVVKDGLKYGTDFLLYKKGVMFGHSQFGIRVIACKSADEVTSNTTQQHWSTGMSPQELPLLPLLSSTPGLFVPHAVHSWQWLLALNRVISQVQKVKG